MTGREKILAAFTPEGAPEIGVVASYEEIFILDHYAMLTKIPWWDWTKADSLAKDYFRATSTVRFSSNGRAACPSWYSRMEPPCQSRRRHRSALARYRSQSQGISVPQWSATGLWLSRDESRRALLISQRGHPQDRRRPLVCSRGAPMPQPLAQPPVR